MHKLNHGFTIIEIISILVILGILSVVAVTRMSGLWISAYGDADRLVSDLRYAQSLAMTRAYRAGDEVDKVEINIDSDGWNFASGDWRFADGESSRNVRWGVKISGSNNVAFKYPFGNLADENDDVDITLNRGGNSITVRVYEDTGYVEIVQ